MGEGERDVAWFEEKGNYAQGLAGSSGFVEQDQRHADAEGHG
jgi:hypothetical protein